MLANSNIFTSPCVAGETSICKQGELQGIPDRHSTLSSSIDVKAYVKPENGKGLSLYSVFVLEDMVKRAKLVGYPLHSPKEG